MRTGSKILLLAGSAEARQIGTALREQGVDLRALLSEPPRGANPMPMPYQMVDFADLAGLKRQMAGCDAVIDASHGFDGRMTDLGFAAASQSGLPFISLSRPVWAMDPADQLCGAGDVQQAVAMIPKGAKVFSATGWASLPDYADFAGERLFLRQTTRHDRPAPFDFVALVFGDPPFSQADETELFQRLGVEYLICRNLGGLPSRPKVDAALALGMKTILIDRPAAPKGSVVVADIAGVLAWVADL
ncbi:MAG: precorrin-6A/cobalt-precorrin-6A reductase [Sulfitobacter sp.]|jgi:precorrin-6A/cobalt-precorrin-6A reductase